MKNFFTSCFVLGLFSAQAQITVTTADMPVVNDTVRLSTTFDQWSIDLSQTGPNFNWDFSFLTPTSQTLDTFYAVTATPFLYQFYFNNNFLYPEHKANYALHGADFDFFGVLTMTKVFNYYKNSSGEYKNVGFGANINGLPASVRNIPIDTVYKFPLTDGTAYDSYSEYEVSVPSVFYYRQKKTVSNATVDGYGSLTTPYGTFQVVRVRMDIDINDSIYVDAATLGFQFDRPTETQYHWIANGEKVPVLQINSTFGLVTTIKYKDFPIINVGMNENDKINLMVYPNPATEVIIVEAGGETGTVEFFDALGKLVMQTKLVSGSEKSIIPVSTLGNGYYFVKVSTAKGTNTEKILINN